MIKKCDNVALAFKARATGSVKAIGAENFKRHGAAQWFILLGKPYNSKSALAKHATKVIGANANFRLDFGLAQHALRRVAHGGQHF